MKFTTPVCSPSELIEQRTFRALLDGMARPGTVATITPAHPEDGRWACALTVVQSLADHEVTFAVSSSDPYPAESLLRRTSCRLAPTNQADYVLADAPGAAAAVYQGKEGSLEYPDESVTLIIACSSVGSGPVSLQLAGPGIPGSQVFRAGGVTPGLFIAFAARNAHFPVGIDLVLAGEDNRLACLPRSTSITVH